jgi:hypothetical protein
MIFRLYIIASAIVLHLLLPLYLSYQLAKATDRDRAAWLLKAVLATSFAVFVTVSGRWDFFSRYLRFLPAVLIAGAAIAGYRRIRERPFYTGREGREWLGTGITGLEVVLIGAAAVLSISGQFYAEEPVRLAFPLENGTYYVGQGGNHFLVNYHNAGRSQAFAADIVALNELGMRAQGIYPEEREDYAIYGETVVSPCAGTVTSAAASIPAQAPGERDGERPAGNHVMIACKGVSVLLAHLQPESVMVDEGQRVATGEPVGRVGNTGNTTEPHLHIHAVAGKPEGILEGEGVPMVFGDRFPVRNVVFER